MSLSLRALPTLTILACLLAAAPPARAQTDEDAREHEEATRWIDALGHTDYAAREEAMRRILEIGPEALPALEARADDPDPEVRQRIAILIARLERLRGDLFRWALDLAADAHSEEAWSPILDAAASLDRALDVAIAERPDGLDEASETWGSLPVADGPIDGSRVEGERRFVGSLRTRAVRRAVLVVDGDLEVDGGIAGALVVVTGDLKARRIRRSMVLVAGRITVGTDTRRSVLMSRGGIAGGAPATSILLGDVLDADEARERRCLVENDATGGEGPGAVTDWLVGMGGRR